MRANLFLLIFTLILGLLLWTTLSGALLVAGSFLWLLFIVATIAMPDKAVLFFLGAREVRSSDESDFFQAALQEAYKLSVPVPKLYFYDGSLERGFILQNKNSLSIILSKSLMNSLSSAELSAICFELLLQVKKGQAGKRTKVMFLIGAISWIFHGLLAMILKIIPAKEAALAANWFLNFLLHPSLDLIFKIAVGSGYFRKLKNYLEDYPQEKANLLTTGLKLGRPALLYSLPSRKLLEFTSVSRSRHYQNILSMELLPHEWDYLFTKGESGAAKA